jgi:hypothetical protein
MSFANNIVLQAVKDTVLHDFEEMTFDAQMRPRSMTPRLACSIHEVCVYVYGMFLSLCVSVCMYVSVSVCVYVCMCMCVYAYVCMCACVCVYVCMYVCVCDQSDDGSFLQLIYRVCFSYAFCMCPYRCSSSPQTRLLALLGHIYMSLMP